MGGDADRPGPGPYAGEQATFGDLGSLFADALNELRKMPSARLPYICDKDYRPTEERMCKVEAGGFLTAYFSPLPEVATMGSLTDMARESAESAIPGSVSHTQDLISLAGKRSYDGDFLGEMYWSGDHLPGGPWGIIRDFILDIGRPGRSRRLGLFDPDFAYVGSHLAQFPGGRYVFFLYLGGFGYANAPASRDRRIPDSLALSSNYRDLARSPLKIIDICSDSDMEEPPERGEGRPADINQETRGRKNPWPSNAGRYILI